MKLVFVLGVSQQYCSFSIFVWLSVNLSVSLSLAYLLYLGQRSQFEVTHYVISQQTHTFNLLIGLSKNIGWLFAIKTGTKLAMKFCRTNLHSNRSGKFDNLVKPRKETNLWKNVIVINYSSGKVIVINYFQNVNYPSLTNYFFVGLN